MDDVAMANKRVSTARLLIEKRGEMAYVHGLNRTQEENVVLVLTFTGNERLEEEDGRFVTRPRVHFAVRVAAFLRQFVPRLRLGQQLGDGALRQAQHEFGEQALADVVHRQELADTSRDGQSVQRLAGVALHRRAEHLLQTGL